MSIGSDIADNSLAITDKWSAAGRTLPIDPACAAGGVLRGMCRALLVLALVAAGIAHAADTLRIGSKRFTESYVLGEVLRQVAAAHAAVEHKAGLGNTGIVFAALRSGAIDLYPEYTGTLAHEVLKLEGNPPLAGLNAKLAPLGLAVAVPLGFNNGYALGMSEARAAALGVRRIGELAGRRDLTFGLSQEFIGRGDGWPGLARAYRLGQRPLGLDHGIAYEALQAGRIDVIDLYTTDAKIARYRLRVLADDRGYFPRYDAVILHRADVPSRFPGAWAAIRALEGKIDQAAMIRMNAAAEIEGRSFSDAAALLLDMGKAPPAGARRSLFDAVFDRDFARLTREHLLLVFGSLAASVAVGVPLGVLAAKLPASAQLVLGAAGVIQTIPALALLAFLVAGLGTIGTWPALIALFLYGLLPIARNTHAGLLGVGKGLSQAALALGLSPGQRLRHVELPLAAPTLLAGIKTSAIINVGTATIAAFVGAGGYGERIVAGLALNDHTALLAGALPAAALALLVQAVFELGERSLRPGAWSSRGG